MALDQLGATLKHNMTPGCNDPLRWRLVGRGGAGRSDTAEKLRALEAVGIDTLVTPTVVGLGRQIPRLQQVNEQVDINIIVATGLYTFDQIPHYCHCRGPRVLFDGPELMTKLSVRDIIEGIGDTGVRAAFLKGMVEQRGPTED
ncbi:hypothetical protein [Streptomyces melanosporofaciens]|uniref:Phosphotriesterase family protein n=1 Tax=Streptomyces melanosporofaciens TaxID=67327 RepID=A0A1H4KLD0_STRMJ|nr:hypothetical protein [Streptomyces melanosporofaciens]SEB59369.1 Phosphotriesterase family protein [Streptomyces melanosporofaciens]